MSRDTERIAVLESKVDGLVQMNEKIMTNHLPHIQAAVDDLHTKMTYWSGGIAALVAASSLLTKFL